MSTKPALRPNSATNNPTMHGTGPMTGPTRTVKRALVPQGTVPWDPREIAAATARRKSRPSTQRDPQRDPMIGRVLGGKYRLEAVLGTGASGVVYRAEHVSLELPVAIKVLHREVAKTREIAARFHHEALAASRLDHPSSVRVLDFGEEPDGLLYLVMEYLEGRDLLSVIEEDWPLAPERIALILAQVLAALAIAHERGIVHRDLKPENIMVLAAATDDGDKVDLVKVCDFGIATIGAANGPKLTQQGLIIGTPEYMSPEQARGEPLDARSDLYSVGAILYHMLTGEPPFTGDPIAILLRQITETPADPSTLCDVDPELEDICIRALHKSPALRYHSARAMRAELRSVVEKRGSKLPPMPSERPPPMEVALARAVPVTAPVAVAPPLVLAARKRALPIEGWMLALVALLAMIFGACSAWIRR